MKTFSMILLALFCQSLVSGLYAQVVVSHFGSNNPTTEGFDSSNTDADVYSVANDIGRDAWAISTIRGTLFQYHYDITDDVVNAAYSFGWTLTVTMRNVEPGSGFVDFRLGDWRYFIEIANTDLGDLLVYHQRDQFTIENGGSDYHEFVINYNVDDELAYLWVSGVGEIGALPAIGTDLGSYLSFSTGQGGAYTHWNEVTFAIVPEPASAALVLGVVGLGIGLYSRRGRRGRIGSD